METGVYGTYKGIPIMRNKSGFIRKSVYSIEEIRELTKDVLFEREKRNARVELDGDIIKGNSQRLQTFFTKGI